MARVLLCESVHPSVRATRAMVIGVERVATSEEVRVGLGAYYRVTVADATGRTVTEEVGPYTWRDKGEVPCAGDTAWITE